MAWVYFLPLLVSKLGSRSLVFSDVLSSRPSKRVCVFGCGSIGSLHVEIHTKNIGINNVSIIEDDEIKRNKFEKMGYKTYKSLDDLKNEEYDLYDICLPTYLHMEMIKKIFNSKISRILCEKPIVLDSMQFKTLSNFGGFSDRVFCAFVERFNEPFILAKKWTYDHKGPYEMRFVRRTKKPIQNGWIGDPEKGGSVLLDLGVHDIDASIWFSDSLFCEVVSKEIHVNTALIKARFNDGSVVSYDFGWDLSDDSELGVLNNFSIRNSDGDFCYDSVNETIIFDSRVLKSTPRFPFAYELELKSAISDDISAIRCFPNMKHINETYKLLDMIYEKESD